MKRSLLALALLLLAVSAFASAKTRLFLRSVSMPEQCALAVRVADTFARAFEMHRVQLDTDEAPPRLQCRYAGYTSAHEWVAHATGA